MLSSQDNEVLTQVGPGTPMGNLLRRYWTPACLSSELPNPDDAPVRVRLFGEDLVAFRDTEGKVGLIGENCPHRGASMYFGRNEECGLRCVYHGWKFDVSGQCVDMPSEPRPFAAQIKATSYPTHESGGIVWTYMGPYETMTAFRDFGTESLAEEHVAASKMFTPCNWVQSMDGNVDTAHISFLHAFNAIADIPDDGSDAPGYPGNWYSMKFRQFDKSPALEISEEHYGYRYAGLRHTPNGYVHARVSAYIFPYATIVASIPFGTGQIWVVPIDDTTTWRYTFATNPPLPERDPGWRLSIPDYPFRGTARKGIISREFTAENEYQIDRVGQRTSSFTGVPSIAAQDLMVTESMGPVQDRTAEHLGTSDLAVSRMHAMLLNAAKGLAAGVEPPSLGSPDTDFRGIRSGEKVIEREDDWRLLGTDADAAVQEAQLNRR
jgi:phthalate 4,5-dioxygenase